MGFPILVDVKAFLGAGSKRTHFCLCTAGSLRALAANLLGSRCPSPLGVCAKRVHAGRCSVPGERDVHDSSPGALGNPLHALQFCFFLSASSCSTVTAHRLRCRGAYRLYLRGVTAVASFEVGSHPSAWKQRTSSPSQRRWSWVWHRLDEDFMCRCSYFLLFKYVVSSGRLRQSGLLGFALLTECSCFNCSASQELVGKAVSRTLSAHLQLQIVAHKCWWWDPLSNCQTPMPSFRMESLARHGPQDPRDVAVQSASRSLPNFFFEPLVQPF